MHIAQRAAQDHRQRYGGERYLIPEPDQRDENGRGGHTGKNDQGHAHRMGRSAVGKQRKRGALVEPVRDAQNAGKNGNGAAKDDVAGHPRLGPAIGRENRRRDQQQPRKPDGVAHATAPAFSACGGATFISFSADWQRVHTFCHTP